ncbi:MAG: tRNA (adenosine(37)-N6)-dimethylallyltransferase MiaA [Cyanobacteria bacterium]|nr:tRNA (adenosine(37)-N6)-dimethylallyltransferase MiaA [Cyanobacteriota bacterium]
MNSKPNPELMWRHRSLSHFAHCPIIAVVGPTATGKTSISIALAKAFQTEIISADSQLVYQGLDIGTAKPTFKEREGIVHHLIDCVSPEETFTVEQYTQTAQEILNQFTETPKPLIITGGTGFYLRALLEGIQLPGIPPNPDFRKSVENKTNKELYLHLQTQDSDRASTLSENDRPRIIRALEIIDATGQPVPKVKEMPNPHPVLWIGLNYSNRDEHRHLIDQRIEAMLKAGWLAEVEQLMTRFGDDAHALTVAHGYPEWIQYIQGNLTYEQALSQVQLNIHQYARRQRTWFRRNSAIHWYDRSTNSPEQIQLQIDKQCHDWLGSGCM